MHACYYACMAVKQYTVRNIPEPVNRYLRKRARLSGKSLNQVIIEELSEKVASASTPTGESLSWFIGSGIDDKTLQALDQEEKIQKELAKTELRDAT
jgi:plasmid stability protein